MCGKNESIGFRPKVIYGIRNGMRRNIHFTTDNYIIYTAEGCIIMRNYAEKDQQIFPMQDTHIPWLITTNISRNLLAIVEYDEIGKKYVSSVIPLSYSLEIIGSYPSLNHFRFFTNIYETLPFKLIRTLSFPEEICDAEPNGIDFLNDSSGIIISCRSSCLYAVAFYFDKKSTIIHQRICRLAPEQKLLDFIVACNLRDALVFAVSGHFGCRIFAKQKQKFIEINSIDFGGRQITTIAWITADIMAIGTAQNELIFVENGNIKSKFVATDVDLVDLEFDEYE